MKQLPSSLASTFIASAATRAIALVALVLAAGASVPSSLGATAGAATLVLSAPAQVAVGEAISVVLAVRNATDLAGYEAAVRFDPAAAEFAGLSQQGNDLQRMGRDIDSLAVAELATGAAIGLYSCPAAQCASYSGPRQARGASGDVTLATLDILPLQPGVLEIALDATKFVDADGNAIAVDMPSRTLSVQVGPAGGPRYAAPARPWALAAAAPAAPAARGALDLTFDNYVSDADLMQAALGWTTARERGKPCGVLANPRLDINRDGCIDVADLQLLAAQAGPPPAAPMAAAAMTFVVNSTDDAADASPGDSVCAASSGACTLRAAIEESNRHAGPDTIAFNIPGGGVKTIQLASELPTLSGGDTTIDGYTQPGAQPNTDPLVSNASIQIQITARSATFDAFQITSARNVVRGLAIYNVFRKFWLYGGGARSNVLAGNFIGTNAAGTFGTNQPGANGVYITQRAARNRIGGPALADRNVISGNGRTAVGLWFELTDANVISNNLVGLNPNGTTVLGNRFHGIDMNSGVSYTVVGGSGTGERNVVVGSERTGIEISHSGTTNFNQVIGNFVGTNVTGTDLLPGSGNGWFGIQVKDRTVDNLVTGNVVGGSGLGGIRIDEFGNCCVRRNRFSNNRVGVGVDGKSIPNKVAGFFITAGLSAIGPGNVVAYNPIGILVDGNASDWNTISRNSIYGNDGLGIDLAPIGQVNPNDAGDADAGANQQLNFPVLQSATPQQVAGTSCAGCTVEVFVSDSGAGEYGEGKTFVGAVAAAANGSFAVPINGAATGEYVTATATSPTGNTSEFALNLRVGAGPAPGATPSISSINPSTVSAGGTNFVLTVTGANFGASSVVRWNGAERPTTFINSTQLTALIAPADVAAPGTAAISVLNRVSGGTSNSVSLVITNPVPPPTISGLSPSAAQAGGAAFTLTVNGANFTQASVVRWNDQARPTTFVNGTQLTAAIGADDIATPGAAAISVLDDATKRVSDPASFTITSAMPPPAISSLSPSAAQAGGAAFTLTVNGANFTEDSLVEWNGAERATTFVSSTKLQATIPASDIVNAGAASVTVSQSDTGAIFNAASFTVRAPGPNPDLPNRIYLALVRR